MLAKELGSGAFSVVKLGIHLETSKKTAVKIVSKKKLSEEDFASLMTEIEILAELNHPHIIKYDLTLFPFPTLPYLTVTAIRTDYMRLSTRAPISTSSPN